MSAVSPMAKRDYLPPIVWRALRQARRRSGFFGDYPDWAAASADAAGYDSAVILERVRRAVAAVRDGEAVFERDSVLFDRKLYAYPLLAWLLRVAGENGGALSVLDFGGSLGSTYFQCQDFLAGVRELRWSVVEQPRFVECGKAEFEDARLRFYPDIDACLAERRVDVLLVANCLQYLPAPHAFLADVAARGLPWVIFDTTAVSDRAGRDQLTVQVVPPEVYGTTIPAWIFDDAELIARMSEAYELVADYDAMASEDLSAVHARYKGFVFRSRATGAGERVLR